MLHRDLKPSNILLDEDDEPHVGDFGLAKELDSDSDLTHTGPILGSPNYMSPELAAGKSTALTVGTDIYSLGVMLYQMLTGRAPFPANTPLETMRLVLENEPQRPSTIAAPLNMWLNVGLAFEVLPGAFQFIDPQAPNYSRRFYRVQGRCLLPRQAASRWGKFLQRQKQLDLNIRESSRDSRATPLNPFGGCEGSPSANAFQSLICSATRPARETHVRF